MRNVLFVIGFILTGICFSQNNTVGLIEISNGVSEGYTLFAPMNSTKTYLIDNCGRMINTWTSDYNPAGPVYLKKNGDLVRAVKSTNTNFKNPKGPGGGLEIFDWNGNLVSSFYYNTGTVLQHHDVSILPNGNILLLAWDLKNEQEAIESGRNPIYLQDGEIWSEQIIEIDLTLPEGEQIVWKWNLWDHLVQDFDETMNNYGVVSENPFLVDINYLGSNNEDADWIHANSMDYNAELDQIVISSRDFNEFWIIDHSTTIEEAMNHSGGNSGRGGDILYRWGNPATYRAGDVSNQKLFGQHNVHWISSNLEGAGSLMIFNNGFGRQGDQYSSIEVLMPELQNNTYTLSDGIFGPEEFVWQYMMEDKTDFYSFFMSGAQRLPNSNTLICSTAEGKIFEVNSKGDIVWIYRNPDTTRGILAQGDPSNIGNGVYDNYIFRATKYPLDYGAFLNRNLTPLSTIESGESLISCDVSLAVDSGENFVVYPNPVIHTLNISGHVSFKIISMDGMEVYSHSGFDSYDLSIPTDKWSTGMYFLIGDGSSPIKILKNQ